MIFLPYEFWNVWLFSNKFSKVWFFYYLYCHTKIVIGLILFCFLVVFHNIDILLVCLFVCSLISCTSVLLTHIMCLIHNNHVFLCAQIFVFDLPINCCAVFFVESFWSIQYNIKVSYFFGIIFVDKSRDCVSARVTVCILFSMNFIIIVTSFLRQRIFLTNITTAYRVEACYLYLRAEVSRLILSRA